VPVVDWLLEILGAGGSSNSAAALLIAAAVFAAGARLLILWTTQRTVLRLGHELSAALFSKVLRQPYSFHASRNPSELYASVEKVQLIVYGAFYPLIQGVVACVMAIAIVASLLALQPHATVATAAGIGIIYVAATMVTRARLRRNSTVVANAATERMKALQESLGGIRDIILGQTHARFEERFNMVDLRIRTAQTTNMFISAAPRYVIEAGGIIVLGLLALYLSRQPGGLSAAIPTLGPLALGAQRLLPLLQQAYLGWSNLAGNAATIRDVLELIDAPASDPTSSAPSPDIPFDREISIEGVTLSYPGRAGALRGVDMRVLKGQRIGIMGPSGSGKSSLLDVLTGLLEPTQGEIRVDGRPITPENRGAWQRHIAYVPQMVYLPDASISQCIAFGNVDLVHQQRVEQAAKQAQLHEFILTLPAGYDTQVGERGVRLSGGQRQRIGIARALYKRASVLILDEATGALDAKTEAEIIEGFDLLERDVSLLIVSHRKSALSGCDAVVTLEAGAIASFQTQPSSVH
jgi:ATP-binding cassette subfamily B protein